MSNGMSVMFLHLCNKYGLDFKINSGGEYITIWKKSNVEDVITLYINNSFQLSETYWGRAVDFLVEQKYMEDGWLNTK